MLCQFRPTAAPGIFRCRRCGYQTRIARDKPPLRNCPAPPTVLALLLRYLAAMRRYFLSRRRTRGDVQTRRIYETLCKPCPHFDGGKCKLCGCRLSATGPALLNKIRIASEHCPIGKW